MPSTEASSAPQVPQDWRPASLPSQKARPSQPGAVPQGNSLDRRQASQTRDALQSPRSHRSEHAPRAIPVPSCAHAAPRTSARSRRVTAVPVDAARLEDHHTRSLVLDFEPIRGINRRRKRVGPLSTRNEVLGRCAEHCGQTLHLWQRHVSTPVELEREACAAHVLSLPAALGVRRAREQEP